MLHVLELEMHLKLIHFLNNGLAIDFSAFVIYI